MVPEPPPDKSGQESAEPSLAQLKDIHKPERPTRVDSRASLERQDLENQRRTAEVDLLQAKVKSAKQDISERQSYASRIYWVIIGWLAAMFGVVVLEGFGVGGFDLADSVLLTLIGGTTANVLGIFVLVARYLFWRGSS